jgi:hypothetical protein
VILWHAGITMLIVWFVMRGNTRIDYRVVAFASLIPDLIDKPIGRLLFRDEFENGRIFGHTLLLNVAFFCVLFFMRGRRKRQFTLIPLSSLLHLAEDGMWGEPKTFWWPLFGTSFPRDPQAGGFLSMFDPTRNPGVFAQEVIGALAIAFLLSSHGLLNRSGIRSFLKTGRLEASAETAA